VSGVLAQRGRARSRLRVLVQQIHLQSLLLLRSPSAPFFTFVVPLMLLVALDLVYGTRALPTRPEISFPQFYVPAMTTFALVNGCYVNVINGVTLARQTGLLKRIRGTPLPGWVYLASRGASAAIVGSLSVVGVAVLGTAMFDARMVWSTLPGSLLMMLAGMVCLCCLGLALTTLVPAADAALPMAYGTFLPLAFISDVFFPSDTSPAWLRHVAGAFPLRPIARSLEENMEPGVTGLGFHWAELGIVAVWTVGAAIALHWFRWEPGIGRRRRGRGRGDRGLARLRELVAKVPVPRRHPSVPSKA
jgi:ABC-type multidrug transport system permease subunit